VSDLAGLSPEQDFFELEAVLDNEQRRLLGDVRTFMREEVAPIINDYWSREEFPHQVWPRMAELGIGGLGVEGYGCPGHGVLVDGFVAMELAAVDCSVATGLGVHNHLAMGSLYHCGSEEQKEQWLPQMARFDAIGAFGLTEPDVGSGVARGLQSTARRDGDTWILNGAKRWIGNATFADLTIIWARDEADDAVKGFIVEKDTPGFTATKMEHKIALRAVQNADITSMTSRSPRATGCRTPTPSSTPRTSWPTHAPPWPGKPPDAPAAPTTSRCNTPRSANSSDGRSPNSSSSKTSSPACSATSSPPNAWHSD
jgi:glutaryl-CoA dehydrogenase